MTPAATKEVESPRRVPTIRMQDLAVDYMAIFNTQSKTRNTEAMGLEIMRQLEGIKGVEYALDEYGNIYARKGKAESYPAYVCHIDTVHEVKPFYQVVRSEWGHYYAVCMDKDGEFKPGGIGGDDKCGIIACLELLHRLKKVKCVFFLDEEAGCLGSAKGELGFFDDCRFAIQIDRKGKGDIITKGRNGTIPLCSQDFEDLLNEVGKAYGYKSCTGANTDVVQLKERGLGISVVNLSAGYYNQHTDKEYIVESEFLNCLQFARTLANFTTVYPHKYVKPAYTPPAYNYHSSRRGSYTSSNLNSKSWNCAECDALLPPNDRDDGLCKECIESFRTEAFLEISAKEGQELIIDSYERVTDDDEVIDADVDIVLPQKLQDRLPANGCLFCHINLVGKEKEQQRGYCEACKHCACGELYQTVEEMIGQSCGKCLDSFDSMDRLCQTTQCVNVLQTTEELIDNICSDCKEAVLLPRS